jgi:tetratricopeptide (TPR) repeat protein
MQTFTKVMALGVILAGLAQGCAQQDPDARRGDVFFKTKNYAEAIDAYGKAVARDPKLMEDKTFKDNYIKAHLYYGGRHEMSDSLDTAITYYEKALALDPNNPEVSGVCDKIAKYYWKNENFAKAAEYFAILVNLDQAIPEEPKRKTMLGEDYYALGYAYYQVKDYAKAADALAKSVEISPDGRMAGKAAEALKAAKLKVNKNK